MIFPKTINKPIYGIHSVLIIFLLISCDTFNSDNDSSSKKELIQDTKWKLESITTETGPVFPDYDSTKWKVPDNHFYSIEFITDSIVNLVAVCTNTFGCSGSYKTISDDSISIQLSPILPRYFLKDRIESFISMAGEVQYYKKENDVLYLYYKRMNPNYKAGELLVKFISDVIVDSLLLENKFRQLNVAVKEHFSHVGVWHLTYYAPDKSDDEVLMIFKDDPRIIAVQFNHEVSLRSNIEDKVTLYLKIIE